MKLIRFNRDKRFEIKKSFFDKGIISIDDTEGYEAREDSIVEFKTDGYFGLLPNPNTQMGFAARMLDPAPLKIENGGNLFGEDFGFKQLTYHENESFRDAAAQAEKTKNKSKEFITKVLGWTILIELGIIGFLVIVKVLPDFLEKNL